MFIFGKESFLLEDKHSLLWWRDWPSEYDVVVWIPNAVFVKSGERSQIYRIGGTKYPILHRVHTSKWPQLKN